MNQKIGKIPVVFSCIFNILYTEECTHKEAEQVLGVVRSMVNESRKFAEYDTIDNYLVRKKQRNADDIPVSDFGKVFTYEDFIFDDES